MALNLIAWGLPVTVAPEGEPNAIGVYTWMADPAGVLRFCGFFGQPNAIGSLMFSTVCAGIVYWRTAQGWSRWLIAIAMAASIFLASLADSRSSFVGVAVGIAAFTVWKYRFRGFLMLLAVLVLLAGIYSGLNRGERTYFNRDVNTFTGRTTLWNFELTKLAESPLLGYGYDIEGGLFEDRYFPDWTASYAELHNTYLSVAISVGVPALVFWLFVTLSPWAALFRGHFEDDWRLKPMFFLVVLPALVVGAVESGLAEPRYPEGLLIFLCWFLAERYRLAARAEEKSRHFNLVGLSGRVDFERLLAN